MAGADGEWLRNNESLWISASIVAGQEISQATSSSDMDSPEHPMPIIKASDLGQRVASQEGDRIFLGAVSVLDGANIRSGPSLEHDVVSPVSFGSLIAWVAMSVDREWLYLQNGHWISADLVSESEVYRITNTDEAKGPVDGIPVIDISQEQIGQSHGPGYLATVISESGAGIRSGPGFEYELVDTKPLSQEVIYLAQSNNGEWLLLEDGNWIYALHVSTQGFEGTPPTVGVAEVPVEDLDSSSKELKKQEARVASFDLPDLRQRTLAWVNRVRKLQNNSPVRLGDNQAAQNHSTEMIQQRYLSLWNMAGHSAEMQYTLGGGEGYSEGTIAYNGFFVNTECVSAGPAVLLFQALALLKNKSNLNQPEHTTVNVEISYDCRALAVVLLFEGEYVAYQKPLTIQEGQLAMEGRLLNGAKLPWLGLGAVEGIRIDYLPLPRPSTRGQLFRAGAGCPGIPVAGILIRLPLVFSTKELEKGSEWERANCLYPYDVDPQSEPPLTEYEAGQLALANLESDYVLHSVPVIVPDIWKIKKDKFTIQADVTQVLANHGPGVYMINLRGEVDGASVVISQYAISVE